MKLTKEQEQLYSTMFKRSKSLISIADELEKGIKEIFNSDRIPADDEQKPKK